MIIRLTGPELDTAQIALQLLIDVDKEIEAQAARNAVTAASALIYKLRRIRLTGPELDTAQIALQLLIDVDKEIEAQAARNAVTAASALIYKLRRQRTTHLLGGGTDLVTDLWDFIENVHDDDPQRNDKFFALRERVRALQE